MEWLTDAASRIGEILKERHESISVAEGSCGGLLSATLVAVPGASNFYVGGGVLYTRPAFEEILGKDREALRGLRGSTEPFSLALARIIRQKLVQPVHFGSLSYWSSSALMLANCSCDSFRAVTARRTSSSTAPPKAR